MAQDSQQKRKKISNWLLSERPRERLLQKGAAVLSDAELLAVFVRTGVAGQNAVDLARDLIERWGSLAALRQTSTRDLLQWPGLGPAKVATLLAAFEIGRRVLKEEVIARPIINSARDLWQYLRYELASLTDEIFVAILLDIKHQVIRISPIAQGGRAEVSLSIPRVLQFLINGGAAAVIFAHNHPSGDFLPSEADRHLTQRLFQSCDVVGIPMLDHLVFGRHGFYSFAEEGELSSLNFECVDGDNSLGRRGM